MWNYSLVLPELVIIFIFLIFYFSQPKIPVRHNKAFFFIVIIDLATIIFDVTCSLFLEHFSFISPCILRIQNTIYFILFLQRIICFFMFTTIILNKDLRSPKKEKFINILPFSIINIFVILNLFTNTIFCISEDGVYQPGEGWDEKHNCYESELEDFDEFGDEEFESNNIDKMNNYENLDDDVFESDFQVDDNNFAKLFEGIKLEENKNKDKDKEDKEENYDKDSGKNEIKEEDKNEN